MSQYILFEEDWAKFPSAIVDTKTSNRSFIEICALFKKMGVKNHLFPLALLNPALQGLDPFDEDNLTEEQKILIWLECKYNPWYYLREILRAPSVSGDESGPLIANRAVIAMWWSLLNHIDFALIQIRQTGKSLNADGFSDWYVHFGTSNSLGNLFTKDNTLIIENIARLKKIRKLWPSYLLNILPSDSDNQKEISYNYLGNRLRAKQAQANEDAARNVGRGLTAAYNHTDEFGFLRFVWISVPVMLAGSGAAREQAKRNGQPYCNLFTTTAGMIDTPQGKFAYDVIRKAAGWDESFYDARDSVDLVDMVTKRCRGNNIMINGTFSHRQLGKSDAWLRARIAESLQKGDEARRDFLNEWTAGGMNHPLSREILEKIRNHVIEPLYTQLTGDNYTIRWYIPRHEVEEGITKRTLIAGLDTSEAIGRDNLSMVIIDVQTLEIVGVSGISETNLHGYAIWLAKFLRTHPTITLVPENKSTWKGILDFLLTELPNHDIDPGKRIYSTVVDAANDGDKEARMYRDYCNGKTTAHYNQFRKYFAHSTTQQTRELLYGPILQEAARRTATVIRDGALRDELGGLEQRNGRVDHSSGSHDDTIIAWLLAHWFLTYAKNLQHYGIDPGLVKRKLYEAEHRGNWRIEIRRAEQERIQDEIKELVEELRLTRGNLERQLLQHKIDSLVDRLDQDLLGSDAIGAIDALLHDTQSRKEIEYSHRSVTASPMITAIDRGMPYYRPRIGEVVMYG